MSPETLKSRAGVGWLATAAVLALMLALLCTLAVREDYWFDEGYTVRRVAASWRQLYAPFSFVPPEPVAPFDRRDVFDMNPPFFFTMIRLMAGETPGKLTVRLFSALPLALGLALLAAWARREVGTRGQWAVVLAGVTAPALIYYGHEARPYAFGFMLACLLAWLAARLRGRPGWLLGLSIPVAAAGCLTHFAFGWFTIALWSLQAMAWLQARREGDAPERRAAGAMMAGLAAGALLAVLIVLPQFAILRTCKSASSQVIGPEVLMATIGLPFSRVGSQPLPPWVGFALQGAVVGAVALAARRSPRGQQGLVALALWLFTTALPVIAYYWFGVAFFERYTIFALAGWLMMLGWLAQETQWLAGWRKGAVALLFVALLGVNAGWAARNLGRPMRQEWRPIVETLRREGRPGDGYSFEPYFQRAGFAANARTAPPPQYVDARFGKPAGIDRFWIVLDKNLNKEPMASPDPARWRVERMVQAYQLELYRMDRVRMNAECGVRNAE